jgi:hypothetical protein
MLKQTNADFDRYLDSIEGIDAVDADTIAGWWDAWCAARGFHDMQRLPYEDPTKPCHECEGQGFLVMDGGSSVERCDAGDHFQSDEDALAAAVGSAARYIADPTLPREGVRFEKLVAALGVAYEHLSNPEPSTEDEDA